MICAHLAGIRVFANGGIGGVHRGAETSFDSSADQEELARTAVAVVCAGAKALLDVPKTLECLETRGVPVVVIGPASSRRSGADRAVYPFRCGSTPPQRLPACSILIGRWAWRVALLLPTQSGQLTLDPEVEACL